MTTEPGRRVAERQRGILFISMIVICGILLIAGRMVPVSAQDSKPIASIGGNFNVNLLNTVRLDGSYSYDPGGRSPLSYSWELVSKPEDSSTTLIPDGPKASFGADAVGAYKVKLVVNNGFEDSEPAYAIITVTKRGYE
ncbi:MAG TPA: hypothetical protein VEI96_07420 [Thermodesulfovibrionales bacterium]|nr:hypothetical protein [Thermodesulfovibrionales bacterium]